MSIRAVMTSIAVLAWAAPAAAQERGTVEFGAFGSAASFDKALTLKTGYGGGGRVGVFLEPRFSLEFEKAEMRATRTNGLKDVNVGLLSSRAVLIPYRSGALSLLVGAGAGISTETNFLHTYGVDAIAGAKFALTDNASLRVDGVWDFLANEDWKTFRSVRVGISLFRRPNTTTRTLTVTAAAAPLPMMMRHDDSVSAAETRRLRERDMALRNLRDSLRTAPRPYAPPAAAVTTMQATIQFAFDKSVLTDSARSVLDEKVEVFRANPEMSILMVGYTDPKGTDAYNMALGIRRAEATKAYLVGKGVAAERVIIDSRGERKQIANSAGADGDALNRRAVFRLLIAPDAIVKQ